MLVEGDDLQDPIGDAARSILDGHIVLSRELATSAHFPSIDVLESISRVASAIIDPDGKQDAARLRRLLAAHRSVRELVEIGAYVSRRRRGRRRAHSRCSRASTSSCARTWTTRPTLADTWAALHELVAA